MAKRTDKLRFFTDQNIPDSIGRYLRGRGHSVFLLRKHMADDAKDPEVAAAAMNGNRILVSWDKDFNAQRFQQPRYKTLSRIALSGDGPSLLPAIKKHIRVIEFQWQEAQRTGKRLIVHARLDQVRFKD